jgi:hypothetical protein
MSRVLLAISVLILGCCNAGAQAQGTPEAQAQGTPEERNACQRDASRLCRKYLNDGDNAVQQCLQQHRTQLGRACRKAFESRGM